MEPFDTWNYFFNHFFFAVLMLAFVFTILDQFFSKEKRIVWIFSQKKILLILGASVVWGLLRLWISGLFLGAG
ncbi:MAG TPA: hypothetical protein VJH33_02110 [Candidatus Paceibacterota bacterium]